MSLATCHLPKDVVTRWPWLPLIFLWFPIYLYKQPRGWNLSLRKNTLQPLLRCWWWVCVSPPRRQLYLFTETVKSPFCSMETSGFRERTQCTHWKNSQQTLKFHLPPEHPHFLLHTSPTTQVMGIEHRKQGPLFTLWMSSRSPCCPLAALETCAGVDKLMKVPLSGLALLVPFNTCQAPARNVGSGHQGEQGDATCHPPLPPKKVLLFPWASKLKSLRKLRVSRKWSQDMSS